MKETSWDSEHCCETNNARIKIFVKMFTPSLTVKLNRNLEINVSLRRRMMYRIVYLGWATCHRDSSKLEPNRKEEGKMKSISTQFSWMHHIERQVPRTSHRERIAFPRVGKAMRRNAGWLDCPSCLSQGPVGAGGSWQLRLTQGQVCCPLTPSQEGQSGSRVSKCSQQSGDHQASPRSHRLLQGQAQHIYGIAYVQFSSDKIKGGRSFREREHEICKFLLGDDSEMEGC